VLASASQTLASNQTAPVKLALTAAGRRALSGGRSLVVTVVVTVRDAHGTTRTHSVRLTLMSAPKTKPPLRATRSR